MNRKKRAAVPAVTPSPESPHDYMLVPQYFEEYIEPLGISIRTFEAQLARTRQTLLASQALVIFGRTRALHRTRFWPEFYAALSKSRTAKVAAA